jgi:hypothetical protein
LHTQVDNHRRSPRMRNMLCSGACVYCNETLFCRV